MKYGNTRVIQRSKLKKNTNYVLGTSNLPSFRHLGQYLNYSLATQWLNVSKNVVLNFIHKCSPQKHRTAVESFQRKRPIDMDALNWIGYSAINIHDKAVCFHFH